MTTFVVYLAVALINFLGSIIQGVAGIGDAIFLQVIWSICCIYSDEFRQSPLGADSVTAVTLMMYIRLMFMSPLIVYLGMNDSIFSKQMVIMMAIPSTILSLLGLFLLRYVKPKFLKLLLGYSSLFFAFVYGCIIASRVIQQRRKKNLLKEKHITVVLENEAVAEEAKMTENANQLINLQASFAGLRSLPGTTNNTNSNTNNNSDDDANDNDHHSSFNGSFLNNNSIVIQHVYTHERTSTLPGVSNFSLVQNPIANYNNNNNNNNDDSQPQTQPHAVTTDNTEIGEHFAEGEKEVFVSTVQEEVFFAAEAHVPVIAEDNVPPLSPGKLSPLGTMTYTRVRVNRNLDENGKIRMSTKIGAAVAASLAGIMASMTGVNAPPQIIFILLYDAPNYIVRVNFSAQSIPSNILRFLVALISSDLFHVDQIPLLTIVVLFGFAGVFVGNSVGRLLGPKSFNLFVLCLLLLSALAMTVNNLSVLVFFTIFTGIITVAVGYWENRASRKLVDQQRQQEQEIEKRVYDAMEELQRNNNSFYMTAGGHLSGSNNNIANLNNNNNNNALANQPKGLAKNKMLGASSSKNLGSGILDNDDMMNDSFNNNNNNNSNADATSPPNLTLTNHNSLDNIAEIKRSIADDNNNNNNNNNNANHEEDTGLSQPLTKTKVLHDDRDFGPSLASSSGAAAAAAVGEHSSVSSKRSGGLLLHKDALGSSTSTLDEKEFHAATEADKTAYERMNNAPTAAAAPTATTTTNNNNKSDNASTLEPTGQRKRSADYDPLYDDEDMSHFDHQDKSTFLDRARRPAAPLQAIISPSILASNFARLEQECASVASAAQWLHVDVMDGHFVPNISIGACVVESLRGCSPHWFLDVHLMVSAPAQWVAAMAAAGASQYTFHVEATATRDEAIAVCEAVRAAGMQVGVAIKPQTAVTPLLVELVERALVDMVLVMTVEPGFGGQSFMHEVLPKVTALRRQFPLLSIEVDGGLSSKTIEAAAAAGANVIVAGTSVFKAADREKEILALKGCVEKHLAAGQQQQKL